MAHRPRRIARPTRDPALAGACPRIGFRLTIAALALAAVALGTLRALSPAAARPTDPIDRLGVVAPAPDVVAPPAAPDVVPPAAAPSKHGDFISYVRPDDALVYQIARERAGAGATPSEVEAEAEAFRRAWEADHYHGPDPRKAEAFLARERAWLAATSGGRAGGGAGSAAGSREIVGDHEVPSSPDAAHAPHLPAVEGTLRLFAVAVEFDGTDTVESFSHETGIRTGACVTETVTYSGPLHNTIPHPGPRDNYTFWMPRFDRDFYEKVIFSKEGITERVRADLIDPEDGEPGIDISGLTMTNFYDEMSGGRLKFDGGKKGVIAWVKVPHSVGYYAANPCINGRPAGSGLPTNPRFPSGMRAFFEDLAKAINDEDPDFPWADYDTDGDRVIDHVQIFHAGIDESEGGGIHGNQQIWAHLSSAGGVVADDRGTPDDAADDIVIRGYTIQPENLNLGVLVHEFGHDLGIPDLYTTTGSESIIWWDLMSTGSNPGRLKGSDPTHMGPWTKTVLGWTEPVVVQPGDDPVDYLLGQAALTPEGTTRALRVDLPPTPVRLLPLPAGSSQAWWSGNEQVWADHRLSREIDLTAASGAVSVTFDLDWALEESWDFLFVDASADGGQTFAPLKGYQVGTSRELTTPDDFPDPNQILPTYGSPKNGYTGNGQGWKAVYHDLTALAGEKVTLRLRYVTDDGTQGRGVFADNFRVLAGGVPVFADAVEGGDSMGWTAVRGTIQGTANDEGWRLSDGTRPYPRYYLLEWRNAVSFDLGLKYAYNTVFAGLTGDGAREFLVDHVPSNVPGLLVWLRDTRFGSVNPNNGILGNAQFISTQSEGPKGGLLVVDANPEPMRGPLAGKFQNAFGTFPFPPNDNWGGRVQVTNAAFGLRSTPALTLTVATGAERPETTVMTVTRQAPLPAVPAFHDALGYTPGIEVLPRPITVLSDTTQLRIKRYAFTDPDAGVVVPASGYYAPRTPAGFTGLGAETSPPSADVSAAETMFLRGTAPVYVDVGAVGGENVAGEHTGHPGDRGVHFGYHFQVVAEGADGTTGTVRVWRQPEAASAIARADVGPDGRSVTIQTGANNIGGAYTLTVYSDFDETVGRPAAGFVPPALIPVAAPAADVVRAVRAGGPDALAALSVPLADAKALAWAGRLGAGKGQRFAYSLESRAPAATLSATTYVYGADPARALDSRAVWRDVGTRVYLPAARQNE